MTVLLPIGASGKKGKKLDLLRGDEFELEDSEASKLLELDKAKETVLVPKSVLNKKTGEYVEKMFPEIRTLDRQVNFEPAGSSKKEEPKEEPSDEPKKKPKKK